MSLINKKSFIKILEELENENILLIKPSSFPDFSENFSEEVQEVAYKIGESETGAIFINGKKSFLIIPPFPVEKDQKVEKKDILKILDNDYNLGIILLRLGEYSIGVFKDKKLLSHKTGTQFVSGKTKAGGQSAARYSRVREGQINDFFKKVCFQIKAKFKPYETNIDFIFFGGDSTVAKEFIKNCDYLKKFKIMKRVLNIRHMKHESLKDSLKEVWKFGFYDIQ